MARPQAAIIETLRASGLDVHVNIVGFALDEDGLKVQMRNWASTGGGSYFDATGAQALIDSIVTAVEPPFRVYDLAGQIVADGTVDGTPIELDPGSYRIEVLSDPPTRVQRCRCGERGDRDASAAAGGLVGLVEVEPEHEEALPERARCAAGVDVIHQLASEPVVGELGR